MSFIMKYWKAIVGAICLGLYLNDGSFLLLLVGIGLIAWHFMGNRNASSGQQQDQQAGKPENQSFQPSNPLSDAKPSDPEIPEDTWLCNKCGATTKGDFCEYCDTPRAEATATPKKKKKKAKESEEKSE